MSLENQLLDRLCPSPYETRSGSGDFYDVLAPKAGGWFRITRSALYSLRSIDPDQILGLRRRIWEANEQGVTLLITTDYLETQALDLPGFDLMATDLLAWIGARSRPLGTAVPILNSGAHDHGDNGRLLAMLCVENPGEVVFYLNYLAGRNFITWRETSDGQMRANMEPAGFIHLEESRRKTSALSQGFVAMWFDPRMDSAWQNAVQPAIREAGYRDYRVDRHEHVNRIDDEIIAQIRQSRFLVADFSCEPGKPRGGVYFEAGFALGLGLPVIWTAQDELKSEIHFDIRQYNMIFWKTEEELRKRLYDRIVALMGVGPHR